MDEAQAPWADADELADHCAAHRWDTSCAGIPEYDASARAVRMNVNRVSASSAGRQLLDRLIRQQPEVADKPYGLFWVTGEGSYLPDATGPDRIEQSSGYVVNSSGAVFAFWLGWSPAMRQPALTRWRPVRPSAEWDGDAEYQEARAAAGIGIA